MNILDNTKGLKAFFLVPDKGDRYQLQSDTFDVFVITSGLGPRYYVTPHVLTPYSTLEPASFGNDREEFVGVGWSAEDIQEPLVEVCKKRIEALKPGDLFWVRIGSFGDIWDEVVCALERGGLDVSLAKSRTNSTDAPDCWVFEAVRPLVQV